MPGRKWLVRGLVFSVLGGLVLGAILYQRWTNPTAVRQQVLAELAARLPGASTSIGSARLRLLGGIAVDELRLARRDDRDRTEFAYVPSAVIYLDKEQLREGKRVVRKLELHRPRLHAIRRPDGSWNLDGLLAPSAPGRLIPTLVIQQGTLTIEDQLASPGTPPIELHNVNLTAVNDPLGLVTIKADASSDLTGALQTTVLWQRDTGELALSLQAPAVPVGLALVRRLGCYCQQIAQHARELEGVAKVQAHIGYHPGTACPWSHDISVQLSDGQLRHPQIPLALSHLQALARCRDGHITLEDFRAESGETRIALTGSADEAESAADFRGCLRVERLPLCRDLFERLPETLQRIQHDFSPTGPVNLTFTFSRTAGQWTKHCVVQPVDMTACFDRFPYPLQHLTGQLNLDIDPAKERDELQVNLVGSAGGRPVAIDGTVRGSGRPADVELTIHGADVVMDETLLRALPQGKVDFQALARSFHAAGRLDFVARIRHVPGAEQYANSFLIHFHDAQVRYAVFPYPLENVRGDLDIEPDHWEFRDFHGAHKGCAVSVSGRSHQGSNGDRLIIHIDGTNLPLDSELEEQVAHLSETMRKGWKTFTPSGRIDFSTVVTCLPGDPQPDVDLTVTARACAIRPTFFPCELRDINGSLRYTPGWVALGPFRARHGDSEFRLGQGYVQIKPEGGFNAKLINLEGNPLLLDPEVESALPAGLKKVATTLRLRDPLQFRTQLVIDSSPDRMAPPIVWWDGVLALKNARVWTGVPLEAVTGQVGSVGLYNGHTLEGASMTLLLDQATLFGQPFRDIQGRFEIDKNKPDILATHGLQAKLYGGQVGGPILVEFGSTVRYDVNLTALGIGLEEFGRANNLGPNAQIRGVAWGRLWLRGEGPDLQTLQGEGSLDVPSGRLYNLPLLLDLLKVPGLRAPDRTAFEEAHATFSVRGTRVKVSKVDLFGNAVSLSGAGEMNLDGTDINLDFYAVWGRVVQMLPPLFDKIPPAISKQLLKIKMRGRVGDVRCTGEPVPLVVESLKDLFDRMAGRQRRPAP
jgi:hypothetical protein